MNAYRQLGGGAYLVLSKGLTFGIGPLVGFALIRYLGLEAFGHLSAALALITLGSLVFEAGLQQGLHKLAADNRYGLRDLAVAGRAIGVLLSLLGTGAVLLVAWGLLPERTASLAVLLLPLLWRSNQLNVIGSVLRSRARFVAVGNLNVLASLTAWGPMLALMLAGAPLEEMILAAQGCVLLFMLGAEIHFWRYVRSEPSRQPLPWPRLVRESLPFGLSALLHQLYYRTDTLLISATRAATEVGQFSLGARLMDVFNVFMGIVYSQLLYPKYFKWAAHSPGRIPVVFRLTVMAGLAVGMVSAVLLMAGADWIVALLLGHPDERTAFAVSVLALSLVPKFAAIAHESILSTMGLMKTRLKIQALLVLVNLGLNLVLVPRYGMLAAVWTVLATNLLFFIAVSWATCRYTEVRAPGQAGLTTLCALAVVSAFLVYGTGRDYLASTVLASLALSGGLLAVSGIAVRLVLHEIHEVKQWAQKA